MLNKTIGWTGLGSDQLVNALAASEFRPDAAAKLLGVAKWQFNARRNYLGMTRPSLETLAADQYISNKFDAVVASHYDSMYKQISFLIKDQFRPKTIAAEYAAAINHAKFDDKVSSIISTKVDFARSGFRATATTAEEEAKINEFNELHHVSKTLLKTFKSLSINDTAVVLWQKSGNTLSVLSLPSLIVKPLYAYDKNGRPTFRTFFKIPTEMVKLIKIKHSLENNTPAPHRNPQTTPKSVNIPNFPKHWMDAIVKNRNGVAGDPIYPRGGYVELGNRPDEEIYILNVDGESDSLVSPSMVSVFPAINLRAILQEGEFSTAYLMKEFIHQIKVGAKADTSGSIKAALSNKTWSNKQKSDLRDIYAKLIDKALLEVTGQDHEHVFHFPGSSVTFEKRYATADKKINGWARISDQIIDGTTGSSFSGGIIYLKSYSQQISRIRDAADQFLRDFYRDHLSVGKTEIQWNDNYMKEPKQILEEVRFQTSRGMSMETAASILGTIWAQWILDKEKLMSPEVLDYKTDPKKSYLYYQALEKPVFEPSQGGANSGDQDLENGRPADDDEQSDDNNNADNPKPDAA